MMPNPPPGQGPIDPRDAFGGSPTQQQPGSPMGQPMPGMQMPMMMPVPIPPPRNSFARTIFTTLAVTVLIASVSLNYYWLAWKTVSGGGLPGGANTETIAEGEAGQTIAVVALDGEISDEKAKEFTKNLASVEKDANVKALVVEINSPGGEMTPSDEMYQRIKLLKSHRNVPVVVSMKGLAASGGYYVACAGDHLFAQPTTWTGSIGVYIQRLNVADLLTKYGVNDLTSIGGNAAYKYAGSPTRPETPEHRAYFQKLVDTALAQFKGLVNDSRKMSLTKAGQSIDAVADGRVFTGDEAVKLGLVDQTGYLVDACGEAAKRAGLTRPRVVRYNSVPALLAALGLAEVQAGQSATSRGGIQVNIDASLLRDWSTPRVMYRWIGQ